MSYYQQLTPYKIQCKITGAVISFDKLDNRLSVAERDFYVVIFERLRDITFLLLETYLADPSGIIKSLQDQADFVLIYRPQNQQFQMDIAIERLNRLIVQLPYVEYIEAFTAIRDMIVAWNNLDFFEEHVPGKQLDLFIDQVF